MNHPMVHGHTPSRRLWVEYACVAVVIAIVALSIEMDGGDILSLQFARRGDFGTWDPIAMHAYRFANALTVAAYLGIGIVLLRSRAPFESTPTIELKRVAIALRAGKDPVREADRVEALAVRMREDSADRRHVQSRGTLVFAVFLICCGLSHVEGIIAFAWPTYHVFALVRCATAGSAWVALFWLHRRRAEALLRLGAAV